MSSEWETVEVGDVCSVGDGAHSKVNRQANGILYLTSKNIGRGSLKLNNVDYISQEDFDRLFPAKSKATRRPQPGDILIGIIGTFGNAYTYRSSDSFGFASSIGVLRPDPARLTSEYLYYVITSRNFQVEHASYNAGSVQGYTNIPTIKKLSLPLPPLEQQVRIAGILKALDDRIILLRETNTTLESIAQALFKSWFIDFDPVRAKAEGREPDGMDAAMAALFPQDFEESSLGLIPKGWRVAQLSEICVSIFSGGTPDTRKPEYWNGTLPWFSSGETRRTVVTGTEKHITEAAVANSSTRLAQYGDVLIASAGQGLTRGQTSFCAIDTYINQSVVSVRTSRELGNPAWTFYNLARRYDEMRAISDSHSIRGSLTTKLVASMRVIVPPTKVIRAYGEAAEQLLLAQAENCRRADTLARLRDTLLPRLISGKLRLPEAEAKLQEAAE